MLVARTKKETDALPKRQVAVSRARILPRIAPEFSRATRVRESEENRRMIQTVDQSIEMAHAAVQQTKKEQDKLDHVRHKRYDQEESLVSIQRRLDEARKALGFVAAEKQTVQHEFQVLVRARDQVNAEIARKSADIIKYELRAKRLREASDLTEKKIAGLTQILENKSSKVAQTDEQRKAMESEVIHLRSRMAQYENKIALAAKQHEQTMSTIEEATASFRIFEGRIGQLSQETGYIIGYPKLK